MNILSEKNILMGGQIKEEVQIEHKDYYAKFVDRSYKDCYFTLSESIMARHILLLGGAGAGKTNVFNQIVHQLRNRDEAGNDVFIVFDTKGDFYRNFGRPGDIVLGNGKAYRDISARWNIFDDVLADGEDPESYELNAKEMASAFFEGRGSTTQPFFNNAAKDMMAQMIIYFIRMYKRNPQKCAGMLNNKSLYEMLNKADGTWYNTYFARYPDMKAVLSYIGDGKSGQALGVFAELKSMLSDCFIGVFADNDDKGRFSMRKAVREKGGKAIFIEYDLSIGETMTSIYRLLVDLALKEALGRSEGKENGNVFLVLDELKLLPKLKHLDDALNFGRGMGVKVMAGIQSINQLYDIYGIEKGHVLAGGFSTIFAFRTSDYASRQYVSELFGPNLMSYSYEGYDGVSQNREREGNAVEIWEQADLGIGQAIIGLADENDPFAFDFKKFEDFMADFKK